MRPTRWQYFVASGWLLRVWVGGVILACAVYLMLASRFSFALLDDWVITVCLIVVLVLSVPLGVYVGGLVGRFVLGPIYMEQGRKNGGPFQIGDRVRILVGPHRDCVSTVCDGWQHDSVRVVLGDQEKCEFKDIFYPFQIVREVEGPAERVP
jgi:hypothetical protein